MAKPSVSASSLSSLSNSKIQAMPTSRRMLLMLAAWSASMVIFRSHGYIKQDTRVRNSSKSIANATLLPILSPT